MKRLSITLVFFLILGGLSFGQVSYSVPGAFPTGYPTVAAAIAALNSNGVNPGGVTFNVAAGYTETFTNLVDGLITVTGTAANPIIFKKSGTGANPVISGCTTAPNATDYVFCLKGTDYITFDGIDAADPTGVIEWGYAILKNSATDGSQYVTIKNCNITLKKSANINTVGIYSNNVTPSAPTTQLTVTSQTGANSNNKFYSNTFSNCYTGIYMSGFNDTADPYAYYDQSNEIGKDGGNTVTGGGGSTIASYGIYTAYQDRLTVANNTVNGTVSSTTGTYAAIQLNTANNSNVNLYGNTVSVAYNGTGTFYAIYNNMGATCSNNTCNLYNNTISGCTYPNATSGAAYYINTYISAQTLNIYNNQIQNNVYGSATTTSTGATYSLYVTGNPVVTPTIDIHSNSITGNSRLQSVTGAGAWYFMYILGGKSGSYTSIYDNTISNNTSPTNGLMAGIYNINGNTYKYIYRNTISNLTTINGAMYGIYCGEGYNQYIYQNKIQNLKTQGATSSSYVYGINASGSSYGGPMYIYNNMITELKAPNSLSGTALYGIYGNGSGLNLLGVYNNSIYLDGTSTGTGFGTIGVYFSASPASVEFENNIVINNTTPTGAGTAIALKSNGYSVFVAGPTNFAQAVNNNLYYIGTPGSNHIMFQITDGTTTYNDVSLSNYKNRVWPKECFSFSDLPPFVETTTSPYDLHMKTGVPSSCESAGTVISTPYAITTDFDGDARFPNVGYPDNATYPAVAPDLGADEFGGIPGDNLAPAILFTPFTNTASTDPRVLTATIKDAHGVPTSGNGLPRVAWKKFYNGAWNYATGVSLGNNQYSFTFGGGVNTGDSVFYYLLAQDQFSAINVGTMPLIGASGYSNTPPAATNPPSPLYAYKIIHGRCGTFSVGVGKDFPTLSAAIADITGEGLSCPVVLELTDNLYPTETYPIIIPNIPGASAINTLTIRPATGATPVLSTSYLGATPYYWSMISLNGAQYVIFDGSNSGGSDRSMTFLNTAGGGFAASLGFYNNGTTPASYITVKNCILKAHSELVYNAQGLTFYAIQGSAGFHDILINNNEINSAKYGLVLTGTTSSPCSNVQVTNNKIGSMDITRAVIQIGIQTSNISNLLIEGNEIIGPASGISYPAQSPMLIYASTNTSNTIIRRNKLHDLWSTSNGALGIYWDANVTTLTEISNNLVYNIKSVGSNAVFDGANGCGIFIRSGSNFKIVHNTVCLQGNYLGSTISSLSSCVIFRNNVGGIEFRDNLLKNSSQPISGSPATKSYCIMTGTTPTFLNLNYNDYYSNGINPVIGYYAATDRVTLADWQGACGQDANTINVDPVFTNDSTMKPTSTSMPKAGIFIPSLPNDYAGIARTNPPDIGAYEFSGNPIVTTNAATNVADVSATFNGVVDPMGYTANPYFDYGLTTSYGSVANGSPFIVNGNTPIAVTASVTGLTPNTTYHYRLRALTLSGVTVWGNDMTFTTTMPPCPVPTVVTASPVGSTTATISWTAPSPAPGSGYEYEVRTSGNPGSGPAGLFVSGTTMNTSVNITSLTPHTQYFAYVRANCGDNSYSSWTPACVFMTQYPPLAVTAVVENATCYQSSTGSITTTVTGGLAPYTYLWSNGATSANLTGLAAGSYSLTVTDANLTTATGGWIVTEPTLLQASASATAVTCHGGSDGTITVTVSGGTPPYYYSWSNGATTQNLSGLAAGIYTVLISDSHQCSVNTGATVTEPTHMTGSTVVTPVSCFGSSDGSIALTISGGTPDYTYIWTNGATTQNISGLTVGYYGVTVTDAHGCWEIGGWFVLGPALITTSAVVSNATCPTTFDGSIDLTVTGGTSPYSYSWSNGETTEDLSGLAPGDYTVTVTDSHNCTATQTWTIGIANPICVNISVFGSVSSQVCYNALNTITVAGAPFTFTVLSTGNATFIAGEKISYLPGTRVLAGGKMTGKIAPNGPWCSTPAMPSSLSAGKEELPLVTERASFRLFPNPTNGNFTLEQKGDVNFSSVKVEVYSMNGAKVLTENMVGEKSH